jgi:hypothetical protein
MPTNRTRSPLYLFALALLAGWLPAGPPCRAAVIRTVPSHNVWVTGAVTPYTLNIVLDNTGLGGEPTDAVQWDLVVPAPLEVVADSAALPAVEDDFFTGIPMFINSVVDPGILSIRIVNVEGTGPVDAEGIVGEVSFTVPVGTTPGEYQIALTPTTRMLSPTDQDQPFTTVHEPITVIAPEPASLALTLIGLLSLLASRYGRKSFAPPGTTD